MKFRKRYNKHSIFTDTNGSQTEPVIVATGPDNMKGSYILCTSVHRSQKLSSVM